MARKTTYTYTIPMGWLAERNGHYPNRGAVLDMMRYDGATVVDWSSADDGLLTLRSERYTPERWASFGLHPTLKSEW